MRTGRPRDPVTEEDCERWLAREIADVTRRYAELKARVERARTASAIAATLAEIYLQTSGFGSPIPVALVEQAFALHGVRDLPRELMRHTSAAEVTDAGSSLTIATRIVARITGVSEYAMRTQRRLELRAG